MAGTKEIKRRIVSVKNTKKITKAMELVSASKMKRAVNATLASRLYSEYSAEILESVAANITESNNPFFNEQPTGKTLIVLITSSRGLCGGYNAQAIKKAVTKLKELDATDTGDIDMITVGKKGDTAMRRIDQNITSVFTDIPDVNITLADVFPLSKIVTDGYKSGVYKKVFIVYTYFASALVQKPTVKQLLPISKQEIKDMLESSQESKTEPKTNYLFEGDFDTLLESLANKITRMQIYQMLLESNASEQSARMLAMKNASDASGEMIDELTLMFNKARQANITREISEISAGMASVE
ncbi:MAG TPA: ATP synthase F1 subunit gamma [Candidatus Paceibacterota bacterium]|jgi:F-type H+-transporting ATPase subunit gamma|nr:ATP synthase F1 subunit gamma [Candidatus Paceibacterota bacterium]